MPKIFAIFTQHILVGLLITTLFSSSALADRVVDLKVLVVATGTTQEDAGLDLIDDLLEQIGVPYDVLDASRVTLTSERLAVNDHGFYNGIILTNSEVFVPGVGSGLTADEWQTLHDYERKFKVRESIISGYPAINPALGLHYGMTNIGAESNFSAQWQAPAGGKEFFEYVNTKNPLPISDFAFTGTPLYPAGSGVLPPAGSGIPVVQPLLVDPASGKCLVSLLFYEDGREVLLSTISNAWFLIHSQILNYEFLNFATKGVFIGARKVYLAAHLDDLFIADDLWNPVTNQTDLPPYRNTGKDIKHAVKAQQRFILRHPTVANFKLDFAFNGMGAELPQGKKRKVKDPLTRAIMKHKDQFRFINHTFTHPDLDASAGLSYAQIQAEVANNRKVWKALDLPEFSENLTTIVTGNHSGLEDKMGTESDFSDDIPYPDGMNHTLMQVLEDSGVRSIASDTSRQNQAQAGFMPGYDLLLSPRYPANLFYNVIDPRAWVDEYNYVFHERYLENGQDPCVIPGAICQPRTLEQILAAEAETAFRHLLTYRPWPHYFHVSNLHEYAKGRFLMFDWLDSVVTYYEQWMNLPIMNLPFYRINQIIEAQLQAHSANVAGSWNLDTNLLTIKADRAAEIDITGVQTGALYGGQKQDRINIGPAPLTLMVDRQID